MASIKIKDIKISNRFRKDFGEINELAENIKQNKLIVPIVIDKNNILVDGERRIKAHKLLNLKEIEFTRYPEHTPEAEASANQGLHFNIIEAVSIWNAMEKKSKWDQLSESDSSQNRRNRAAKLTDYSHDTLSKAKYILEKGKQKEKEELIGGKSVNKTYSQIKAREEIEEEKKKEKERREKEEKENEKETSKPKEEPCKEETYEESEENYSQEEVEEQEETTPEQKIEEYKIIYADPPWNYNKKIGEGIASEEYSTMKLDNIKNYLEEIKITGHKNSMLFLWVTFPLLKEGLEVMNSWGFEYKTCGFNWIKLNKNGKPFFGIGHYTKSNSELCLIGIKGKGITILDDTISQIIMTEKDKHSKKPDQVPEYIERLVGERKRIELFARKKREGWDVYGDEIK